MKEQISDLSKVLQSLNNELQSMRQTIDAQYTMICQLNRNSEAQLSGSMMMEAMALLKEKGMLNYEPM